METKTPISQRQSEDVKNKEVEPQSLHKETSNVNHTGNIAQRVNAIAKRAAMYVQRGWTAIRKRHQIEKEKRLYARARFDCVALRIYHRSVNGILEGAKAFFGLFVSVKLLQGIGDFFYAMGFQAEYRLILLGRLIKLVSKFLWLAVFQRILATLRFVWREIVIIWRELFRPFYVFGRGIYRVLAHGAKITKEKNLFFGIFASIAYLFRGLLRYVHVIPGMISYVLPFVAAAGFLMVLQNTFAEEYTLEVKVKGETIGYVENEMIFENAKDDVQERVEYAATNDSKWDISPTYALSTKSATMSEIEMADAILMASNEEISEGTAVYIDGELRLITDEGDKIQAYLDSLTAPFQEDDDPTMVVSFNKDIELVEGIYFTETFTSVDEIIEYFSGLEAAQVNYTVVSGDSWSLIASKNGLTQAEIFAMNPGLNASSSIFPGDQIIIGLEKAVLEVLIYRTIEYDEAIAYSTTKTESNDYNFGTTKVTQQGVDGVRHITAEVMYDADGNALHTEILTTEVTLEPVTQVEVVGTYLPSGMIAEVGTGSLIWPVPNYTYVSRWAHASHDGVDICGPAGTAIYAADSGVVVKAGYNRAGAGTGYGYSIVIDHGNGYQTLYAHGLSVAVSAGDVVTQGQYIMPMGSTGYSTGNHLHYEITYNGALVWPQNIY